MVIHLAVKRKSGRPAKVPGEKATKEKIFDAASTCSPRGATTASPYGTSPPPWASRKARYTSTTRQDEILDSIFEYMKARLYARPGGPGNSPEAHHDRRSRR